MDPTAPFPLWLYFFTAFCAAWIVGFVVFSLLVFAPWMQAQTRGLEVSLLTILGIRLRGIPPGLLIDASASLKNAGLETPLPELEVLYTSNKPLVRSPDDLVRLVKESRGIMG